jgi:cysteine desulfurase
MNRIYLDYAATTPVDDRVINAMLPFFQEKFGNPSSLHAFGQVSESALDESRRSIAANLGASPAEIIFTSCGSESDNLAIRGSAFARRKDQGFNHILISPIEHPAVQATVEQLANLHGFEIGYLATDQTGRVDVSQLEDQIREDTALVSVMAANNEIGTINPIQHIAALCRKKGIPFHSDAVQYGAHHQIDVNQLGVDLLSLGGHKFYGPKGVGVLYVRSGAQLLPTQTGGSQEFGLRAATENIPLIVGMAEAFRLVQLEGQKRREQAIALRDRIIHFVLEDIPDSQLTGGSGPERLPNHASFVFKDLDGNLLIQVLDSEGFACSSGSACKTGDPKPSSVLTHLGFPPHWSLGSLRVTLGKDTTPENVDQFLERLPDIIRRVREASR